jgi:N,N-dimethylformamidase beta subunit-like protein
MIHAYPEHPSILPGRILVLRVSTDAPQFRVDFYRVGVGLLPLGDLGYGWLPGNGCSIHGPDEDWGVDSEDANGHRIPAWYGYKFTIPESWPSAVYIAICVEGDGHGRAISSPDLSTPDGANAKTLFVIRSLSPGSDTSILYKVPLFTYQAYNEIGDPLESLYTSALFASLRRPGGGTGGWPWDAYSAENRPACPDVYDPWNIGPPQTGSPRQTFAHWDAKFIAWMERNGYRAEYCTDLDIHEDSGQFLASYGLLLSVGHDEYWSQEMRDNVANYIVSGGNVAFFSGNTCFRRIEFEDTSHSRFRIAGIWWQLGNPENSLTGVSYRNGGGHWNGPRPGGQGYTVQNDHYWFYRFSNLRNGNVFGDNYYGNPNDPAALVGYECDGAHVDRSLLRKSPIQPTGNDSTPANFVILGWSDVTGWEDFNYPDGSAGNRVATMGFYINTGTVFNAATTDWARVLESGKAPEVERITRNVLNGLSRLYRVPSPIGIAGFFSTDDNCCHAIVASSSGAITDCSYNLECGKGVVDLLTVPGAIAVGGFFSKGDNSKHVVVGTAAGEVIEVLCHPKQGQSQDILTSLPGIVSVAGFFSSNNNDRHVIVGIIDGKVIEVLCNPKWGRNQAVLANLPGIVSVAGFFSSDDNYRHVIIGTRDGNVTEVFYNPQRESGQIVLANLPGIISIASFFSSDDNYRHTIVAIHDGNIMDIFYQPGGDHGQVTLASLPGVISLTAFYSEDDRFRHVIIYIRDGTIREIFYHPEQGVFLR